MYIYEGFPGGSVVKNLPSNAGDMGLITGLGRSSVEENGYHSSILIGEIPWTEEPGGLWSMQSQRVRHELATMHAHILTTMKPSPLQRMKNNFPSTL